jgi:MFS family permease
MTPGGAPGGGRGHRLYTVVVFIILASLDNVAIGLVPPLFSPISQSLRVSEATIGLAVGTTYIVSAVAAVGWAYAGDLAGRRNGGTGNRKHLLMLGTLIWAAGTVGTALAPNYLVFLLAQVVAAIGLGAVASVGFSVVSDLIAPRRRGLVMSFWGLSQGVGTLAGTLLGGLLGSSHWQRPFYALSVIGLVATFAYLFTVNIRRGESEPKLAAVFAAGEAYDYRISRRDLPRILDRRTNVWLILQGLTAQVVFGSLVFLPRLFQAKAESIGYSQTTAIDIGSVYATLFQLGAALSIVGGLVGDRLQRRTPRGRAMVASVGILAAIPFYMALFFVPIKLDVADGASGGATILGVLRSVVSEPVVAVSFVTALLALALTSANSPNWFALIAEVNPPEHRGTVFSLGNLVNGVGRAAGTGVANAIFGGLQRALPPPLNFAVGLAVCQIFFIPTGLMYWRASRTAPGDIEEVQATLTERAAGATPAPASADV